MSTDPEPDAYRILQVHPQAHEAVIQAAYRALARLYHPDTSQPNDKRMSNLNRAYDLVRDAEARRRYDAGLAAGTIAARQAVGPGTAAAAVSQPPRTATAGAFSRHRPVVDSDTRTIDFGRYTGWSLRDLARTDPDYLRWLRRHSSGLRFRAEIDRLLPPEHEPEEVGARSARR
jgi:curved DNA-binding protein CbpA